MSSSKHFQVTIDPGEKYYLFSQSALDELIANHVKAEREAIASEAERNGNTILAMQIRARGQQ